MRTSPENDGWLPVSFAADVDANGRCSVCGEDYTYCPCPGPTMDGYEYEVFGGVLFAREERP